MVRFLLAAILAWAAGAAAAGTFESCTKSQMAEAGEAIEGAMDLVNAAAAAVGNTDDYDRWFGRYDRSRAETVRATLKGIDGALSSEGLHVVCSALGVNDCTTQIYANVAPDDPFVVYLCPSFFGMPRIRGVVEGSYAFESGTREGTIIHEVSHFDAVAATFDHCYGRTDCEDMARREPARVVRNADSFQYYAEDVALGRRDD